MNQAKPYTKKQLKFLRDKYRKLSQTDLVKAFNLRFKTKKAKGHIVSCLKNHNITSGRTGRYEKGHIPWTAGTAGKGICKPNSGCFKKGNVPGNIKPLGFERVRGDGFIEIKIAEKNPYTLARTRYKHKHVHVWEQANGRKVPKGMVVSFRDSNQSNFKPNNLMLIKRSLLLRLNWQGYKEVPAELKPSVLALVTLKEKMSERTRRAA